LKVASYRPSTERAASSLRRTSGTSCTSPQATPWMLRSSETRSRCPRRSSSPLQKKQGVRVFDTGEPMTPAKPPKRSVISASSATGRIKQVYDGPPSSCLFAAGWGVRWLCGPVRPLSLDKPTSGLFTITSGRPGAWSPSSPPGSHQVTFENSGAWSPALLSTDKESSVLFSVTWDKCRTLAGASVGSLKQNGRHLFTVSCDHP
jgi:hypothetical protein